MRWRNHRTCSSTTTSWPTSTPTRRSTSPLAILDRVKPGWRDRINASTLDLTSNDLCVLGQLYGHYRRGLVSLRDDLVDAGGCKAFFHSPDIRAAWLREIYAVRDEDARLIPTS